MEKDFFDQMFESMESVFGNQPYCSEESFADVIKERNQLRKDLDEAAKTFANFNKQLKKDQDENRLLNSTLASLSDELRRVKEENEELIEECSEVNAENEDYARRIEQLYKDLSDARAENGELEEENEALTGHGMAIDNECNRLTKENEKLKADLQKFDILCEQIKQNREKTSDFAAKFTMELDNIYTNLPADEKILYYVKLESLYSIITDISLDINSLKLPTSAFPIIDNICHDLCDLTYDIHNEIYEKAFGEPENDTMPKEDEVDATRD